MISVEEALEKILSEVKELGTEKKDILDSLGLVITEDIISPFNVPSNDNSAMDGFAVRTEDIRGATNNNPVTLEIIGEIPAGFYPQVKIVNGKCARIMTGGIIPEGADAVIPVEMTDDQDRKESGNISRIGILNEAAIGSNIRKAGEDVGEGEKVIHYGKIIRPAEVGVLASLGIRQISVIRRPRVAIVATGNELLDIKERLSPGKIYNSNSYGLAALVKRYGGIPTILGIAKDDISKLTAYIKKALDYDLLLTSGGVSVGDYDLVKKVLSQSGKMSFWRVRMKPGKPLTFGVLFGDKGKKVPHLGLPGNPVSCMLGFEIFGRPMIQKMMGISDTGRNIVSAIIEDTVVNTDGRRIFTRVVLEKKDGKYFAKLTGSQSSGVLTSMIRANGLAIIPETKDRVEKGDNIEVILIDE